MYKKLIILLFLFLLGCNNNNDEYPSWYLNPIKENGMLFGVGSGIEKEESLFAAIDDLLRQVKANFESYEHDFSLDYKKHTKLIVNANIGKIKFLSTLEDFETEDYIKTEFIGSIDFISSNSSLKIEYLLKVNEKNDDKGAIPVNQRKFHIIPKDYNTINNLYIELENNGVFLERYEKIGDQHFMMIKTKVDNNKIILF